MTPLGRGLKAEHSNDRFLHLNLNREAALAALEADQPLARRAGRVPFTTKLIRDVGDYVLEVSYREDDDS